MGKGKMYILGLESRISKGVENVSRGLMDYMIRGYPLKWGGGGDVEKPTRQLVSLESICWCPCIYSYSIPLTVSHHVNIYTTTAWAEVKSLAIFHLPHLKH